MLNAWPIALAAGVILGFLSGLGVGGGSLLILWLTLVLNIDSAAARGINLAFFLPSAAVACFFRWRQGTVAWKVVLPAAAAGCAAAGLFGFLGLRIGTGLLRKLFGILLLLTGLRELLYKPKRKEGSGS